MSLWPRHQDYWYSSATSSLRTSSLLPGKCEKRKNRLNTSRPEKRSSHRKRLRTDKESLPPMVTAVLNFLELLQSQILSHTNCLLFIAAVASLQKTSTQLIERPSSSPKRSSRASHRGDRPMEDDRLRLRLTSYHALSDVTDPVLR